MDQHDSHLEVLHHHASLTECPEVVLSRFRKKNPSGLPLVWYRVNEVSAAVTMTRTLDPVLADQRPLVSIVLAVFNDEDFVGRAIESALLQSEPRIEVICVDDASTDSTLSVVESYLTDPRLRLIRLPSNRSAYQARRQGIAEAKAPYVLFLDGDDEIAQTAVEVTLQRATASGADVVGFGVQMVMPEGQGTPRFERTLQPKHTELHGQQIISALFPPGQPAQGHLWKYLFRTSILEAAYEEADDSDSFYRANDIPVSFLALSAATRFVSTSERLYRYYFRRGTSGQSIGTVDDFKFYLQAIDSIGSIADRVPSHARASYQSARRSLIGNLVRDCLERTAGQLQEECFELLTDRVGTLDVILASADFCREALPMLVERLSYLEVPLVREARSVVVTTSHLKTGGLQGVVAAQVEHLVSEGISVTVALHQTTEVEHPISPQAHNANVVGNSWAEKILCLLEICFDAEADGIIDHHLLYNEYWPFYVLAAKSVGIGTIGWLHNFALRPVFNGSTRLSFLTANLPTLETTVVLSPTDVAFWSMNGVDNAVYLPNPASSSLSTRVATAKPKELRGEPIELVWWGRLQQSTKQVAELLKVARHLQSQETAFHLSIIGPDGPDLTRYELLSQSQSMGLAESVEVLGPLYGEELAATLYRADVCLMTSAIEGFPLTLVEGQALGLPVLMYELPWLAYADGNDGVLTVPQMDSKGMAATIAGFVEDPKSYAAASIASISAAKRLLDTDFGRLYRQLIEKRLDAEHTYSPTLKDCQLLLRLSVEYSERTARSLVRSRTETESLRKKVSASQVARPSSAVNIPGIENFQQYRKAPSSPLRKLLAKILPSTWKQANFIAERNAKWNRDALKSIARQQQEIARSIQGLQEATKDSLARTASIEERLSNNFDRTNGQ